VKALCALCTFVACMYVRNYLMSSCKYVYVCMFIRLYIRACVHVSMHVCIVCMKICVHDVIWDGALCFEV
jgi:hypothetical protein